MRLWNFGDARWLQSEQRGSYMTLLVTTSVLMFACSPSTDAPSLFSIVFVSILFDIHSQIGLENSSLSYKISSFFTNSARQLPLMVCSFYPTLSAALPQSLSLLPLRTTPSFTKRLSLLICLLPVFGRVPRRRIFPYPHQSLPAASATSPMAL